MRTIVTDIVDGLLKAIEDRADLVSNPLNIVGVGMQLMNKHGDLSGSEKKALLVKALTMIASGEDGVLGTADDKIPKPIVDTIVNLLQGNLINDVISLVADVSKGRFNIQKAAIVAKKTTETCSGCFSFLISKISSLKSKKSAK